MKQLLKEIAENVRESVENLVGREEAWKIIKKTKRDSTKRIDKVAEDAVIGTIKENDIKAAVLSEELGFLKLCENPEFIFVVDPIDGTFNSLVNLPFYSVSIAVSKYKSNAKLSDIEYALVMNLYNGDFFYAEKNRGTAFNNKPARSYRGDAYCIYFQELDEKKIKIASEIAKKANKIRTFGSVALELCYLSIGVFEALIDIRGSIRNVDIAAGLLILSESGGVFSDMHGKKIKMNLNRIESTTLIASRSKKIHEEILKIINKSLS